MLIDTYASVFSPVFSCIYDGFRNHRSHLVLGDLYFGVEFTKFRGVWRVDKRAHVYIR